MLTTETILRSLKGYGVTSLQDDRESLVRLYFIVRLCPTGLSSGALYRATELLQGMFNEEPMSTKWAGWVRLSTADRQGNVYEDGPVLQGGTKDIAVVPRTYSILLFALWQNYDLRDMLKIDFHKLVESVHKKIAHTTVLFGASTRPDKWFEVLLNLELMLSNGELEEIKTYLGEIPCGNQT